jgi:hypothetical protein
LAVIVQLLANGFSPAWKTSIVKVESDHDDNFFHLFGGARDNVIRIGVVGHEMVLYGL